MEQQSLLESICNGLDSAFFMLEITGDRDFRYVKINKAYERLSGIKDKEITGKTMEELIPVISAESLDLTRRNCRRAVETGETIRYEEKIILERTEKRYLTKLTPLKDPQGKVFRIIGNTEDITEFKNIQNELKENQRSFINLMNNFSGIFYRCLYDKYWTMKFVNSGCFRLTGYRPEDLIDNRHIAYIDLIHPDDRSKVLHNVEESLSKAQNFKMEYRIRTRDNLEKWVMEEGFGVWGEDNRLSHLEGFITDITGLKKAEKEILVKLSEIERFNRLTIGREERVIELKKQVNELSKELDREVPFDMFKTSGGEMEGPGIAGMEQEDMGKVGSGVVEALKLGDFQRLFENFSRTMKVSSAVIDLKGEVLVKSPWQRICTDFHRVNNRTCKRCIESDTDLALKLKMGQRFSMYRCKNGLTEKNCLLSP